MILMAPSHTMTIPIKNQIPEIERWQTAQNPRLPLTSESTSDTYSEAVDPSTNITLPDIEGSKLLWQALSGTLFYFSLHLSTEARSPTFDIGASFEQLRNYEQMKTAISSWRDEENHLDWDVCIAKTPARLSGKIRVRLEYKGRSKPTPFEDPWA